MALLEVLTGQSLLHEYKSSTHRIFRLNNIAKALKFLEDSNVKLVSIDAAEIADGNPSLVLGLVWNIILFLQIKELTGNLNRMSSSSSLSSLPSGSESDTSHPSTPSADRSMSHSIRDQRRTIRALLSWVQQRTRKYGVAVQDFAGSWRSGLAFLAIIKAIDSSLVDMKKALERSPRDNLEDAFSIAKRSLNIPRLLEPEDVMVASPDEHSIMTYVTQFLEHFPELDPDEFAEQNEDAPVEMTYVRYKDGPTEEEGQIITVGGAEDEGFTVQLQTRRLTPPQTHDYADILHGENVQKRQKDPLQVPPEKMQEAKAEAGALKLNNVLRRLEMFEVTRRSPGGPASNGGADNGGLEGSADSSAILNGRNAPHHTDNSCLLQDPEGASDCQSSSSFSSISDKEVGHSPLEPHMTSETPEAGQDDDTYNYVLHRPKHGHPGDPARQLTVFQAYRASDSESPLPSSDSEAEDRPDSSGPPKISIIPHDLFYYPHYSVPIADVLQAFADTCPDSLLDQTFTFEVSSEEQAGDNETLSSGVYLDTESIASDTSVEESQEMMSEDFVQDGDSADASFQEPLGRSLANGSIGEAKREVSRSGFIYHPGDNTFQDVGTDSSDEEWKEEWTGTQGVVRRLVDSEDDEDDLLQEEDGGDKRAAETDDFWLSSNVQNESGRHQREPESAARPTDFGAPPCGGGGEPLLASRKGGIHSVTTPGRLAVTSRCPFSGLQSPGTFRLLIVLWILCYFLLILPELDMSKVSFFVDNE